MMQPDTQGVDDEITTRLSLSQEEASSPQAGAAASPPPAVEPHPRFLPVEPPPLPPVVPLADERATPPFLPAVAPLPRASQRRGSGLAIAALLCSLLALGAVGFLTWRFAVVGQGTMALLDTTIGQLEAVCGAGAQPFTFTFSQTVRFKGQVPLPEGLVIPFKGTIPINTVVRIQVPGFPGTPTIEVPINTSVPVDTRVPVPGGITIPIDTAVPVRQDIPIDLCGNDSPLAGFLGRAIQELRSLRDLMRFP